MTSEGLDEGNVEDNGFCVLYLQREHASTNLHQS